MHVVVAFLHAFVQIAEQCSVTSAVHNYLKQQAHIFSVNATDVINNVGSQAWKAQIIIMLHLSIERLIKAALGRVIKLQRKRLFKKVEAAAVLQMDPHLHLAACLEDVTVKLAEAAEELFLDTLSDQLQLFMSQLGDMEPSKLNSTDCTPRSHNLNPDTFKEFAGKLLDGMKHNVAAKHSNGQLVVAGQKLEQLLNPDKVRLGQYT